ncbi:MAG: hypothetical protein R3316_00675 [Rhodovibrionaceae bacterium]|nr:hypothetical protein [Rhodovibrionaceae bacterium]
MGDVVDLEAYRRMRQERQKRRRSRREEASAQREAPDAGGETTGTDGNDERGSPKADK